MTIEILPPEGKIKYLGHLHRRCPSRVRPPHQTRVANFHEPQRGIDVAKIPIEGQTETVGRNGDTVTEEMKKKLQTTKGHKLRTIILHMPRPSTLTPTMNPTTQTTPPRPQRARRSSHDADSTPSFNSVSQDDEATADEVEPWA